MIVLEIIGGVVLLIVVIVGLDTAAKRLKGEK